MIIQSCGQCPFFHILWCVSDCNLLKLSPGIVLLLLLLGRLISLSQKMEEKSVILFGIRWAFVTHNAINFKNRKNGCDMIMINQRWAIVQVTGTNPAGQRWPTQNHQFADCHFSLSLMKYSCLRSPLCKHYWFLV